MFFTNMTSMNIHAISESKSINSADLKAKLNLSYSENVTDKDLEHIIVGFDVSNNGELAVALSNYSIIIFDHNNNPIGKLKFLDSSSFSIFWEKSNLCIYLVRSAYIIEVTPKGEIVNTQELSDSTEADKFSRMLHNKNNVTFGNYTYFAVNNNIFLKLLMPQYKYSVIERIDNNSGEKTIVFDSSKKSTTIVAVIVSFVIFAFLAVNISIVVALIITFRKSKSGDVYPNENWWYDTHDLYGKKIKKYK